jgi:hypothetical protein
VAAGTPQEQIANQHAERPPETCAQGSGAPQERQPRPGSLLAPASSLASVSETPSSTLEVVPASAGLDEDLVLLHLDQLLGEADRLPQERRLVGAAVGVVVLALGSAARPAPGGCAGAGSGGGA